MADQAVPGRRLLLGARLFTGETILDGHALLIEGDTILDILRDAASIAALEVRLAGSTMLAPGLIDIQVNGGGGVLFNDAPSLDGVLAIAAAHRGLGTTAILPTVITDTPWLMRAAAHAAAQAAALPGSGVLGVHLEGPFLSPERPGVHRPDLIRTPEADDLAWLCALPARFAEARVLLTLAPERVPAAVIARLAEAGLLVSGGHSAASLEETRAALDAGLSGFTHLFNAMPPLAGRAPGIALAAMTDSASWCGIIADGIHVHPAMLRLALASKPAGKMILVSDSMPPAGSAQTDFSLQGRQILRRAGRLETVEGVLAGADLDLAQAVRNAVSMLGVSVEEALRMASLYPAQFLGLEHRLGRLGAGHRADLVQFDPVLGVIGTWVGGAKHQAGPVS